MQHTVGEFPLDYGKWEEIVFVVVSRSGDLPKGHGLAVPRDSIWRCLMTVSSIASESGARDFGCTLREMTGIVFL